MLWQVGTNSVLRDHPLKPHSVLLHEGIAELKAAGADVVLIDMQFAPRVIAKSETPSMEDQIALVAKEANVDLFNRFAVMRNWREVEHIPFAAFVAPDQLHMNDWGYACVAKLLASCDHRSGYPPDSIGGRLRPLIRPAGFCYRLCNGSHRFQRGEHVLNDVVGMFEADGNPHKAVADA